MSIKTILAGTFEVFSKAFGYSIQFNNDIFRWMIRKRNKLTYAGYVDVCWNDNFNCHGATPTAVLSFRKAAIGVTLLCTDCDLIAYRILIFVILSCVPVFYAMGSCDAICITNLSHCALSLCPEFAMRCDLSHRRSHLLSNKSQPSICSIQRLNPTAHVRVCSIFGHAKKQVAIQLLHIEFSATAFKEQLSQGREGQPRAVHSMGLHFCSLNHSD